MLVLALVELSFSDCAVLMGVLGFAFLLAACWCVLFDVGGWCCFMGFTVLGLAVVLCVCYLLWFVIRVGLWVCLLVVCV